MFQDLNTGLAKLEAYEGVFFIGKVVDADDPLNLNRVRVKVTDLFEGANDLLPWALPLKPASVGQSASTGSYGSPPVDSDVAILLQNGNPQYPLYFSIQLQANGEFANGSWGWKDQYGNKFIIDKDGITLSAACGFSLNVDKNCKVTLDAPGGFEVNGDTKINGTLDVSSATKIGGSLDVQGAIKTSSSVTASGDIQGAGKSLLGHFHAVLAKDFGVTSSPL